MTLFKDMILEGVNHSIIKRAMENGIISVNAVDIRDFALSKHKTVDDAPYGGGSGMVMMAQPIYDAYQSVKSDEDEKTPVIFMSPAGSVFNQKKAKELANHQKLIILCGHYEGVDQRVIDEIVTDEISIGDYVLTGGELPALVLIDAVSRLVPGVLGKEQSFLDESFWDNKLEYPQYTRPYEVLGRKVPDVLLSGHHGEIEKWRRSESNERTKKRRPDLEFN